jgi:hypothetical protein
MSNRDSGFYKENGGKKVVDLGIKDERMKFFYYIKRFWKIPGPEKKLFIRGFFYSLFCVCILRNLPLKYSLSYSNNRTKSRFASNNILKIKLARVTLNRLMYVSPWNRNCFIKALTFNYVLSKLSIESRIILSLRKSPNKSLDAHAYILVDNKFTYFKNISFSDVNL